MLAWTRIAFASCIVSALAAQDSKPTEAATSRPVSSIERLLHADDAGRSKALIALIDEQLETNALYAGQYSALRQAGEPVRSLLEKWITDAPSQVYRQDRFRAACIRALRDVVDEPTESLMTGLRGLVADEFEPDDIKTAATYALAQFGDTKLVDANLERLTASTDAKELQRRARAWYELSDIHYNLRDYDAAVEAYRKLLEMHESGEARLDQFGFPMPTLYYNCACSLALGGHTEEALDYVAKALEVGAAGRQQLNRKLLETDMDIASIRGEERFGELFAKYFGGAGKDAKSK